MRKHPRTAAVKIALVGSLLAVGVIPLSVGSPAAANETFTIQTKNDTAAYNYYPKPDDKDARAKLSAGTEPFKPVGTLPTGEHYIYCRADGEGQSTWYLTDLNDGQTQKWIDAGARGKLDDKGNQIDYHGDLKGKAIKDCNSLYRPPTVPQPKPQPTQHPQQQDSNKFWIQAVEKKPAYDNYKGGKEVGSLPVGKHYIFCRADGDGGSTWYLTDLDDGQQDRWVNADVRGQTDAKGNKINYHGDLHGKGIPKCDDMLDDADPRPQPPQPKPQPQHRKPGTFLIYAAQVAKAYDTSAENRKQVGSLPVGFHYIYCRADGPGQSTWYLTDLDDGQIKKWINADARGQVDGKGNKIDYHGDYDGKGIKYCEGQPQQPKPQPPFQPQPPKNNETLKKAAIELMNMSFDNFMTHKRSDKRRTQYENLVWTDDGCSSPVPRHKEFDTQCLRHDFGYRNFGFGMDQSIGFDRTEHWRNIIDDTLLSDMASFCTSKRIQLPVGKILTDQEKEQAKSYKGKDEKEKDCLSSAGLVYAGVRDLGRPSFFGVECEANTFCMWEDESGGGDKYVGQPAKSGTYSYDIGGWNGDNELSSLHNNTNCKVIVFSNDEGQVNSGRSFEVKPGERINNLEDREFDNDAESFIMAC